MVPIPSIQAGLFSAVVTAFIIESYKGLSPDPGDATVALLGQISQQLAALSNGSQAIIPTPALDQTPFVPPPSVVRVNILWFLSLAFSLECTLLATLVQQWARSYIQGVERRPAPHKRARIRAYLWDGVTMFHTTALINVIPFMIHISLALFLVGLIEFLTPINQSVGDMVLAILVVCCGLYGTLTILPTLYPMCPYRTPLSGPCWNLVRLFGSLCYIPKGQWLPTTSEILDGPEQRVSKPSPSRYKRDFKALRWTLESLTEDTEIEQFVEAIPDFIKEDIIRPKKPEPKDEAESSVDETEPSEKERTKTTPTSVGTTPSNQSTIEWVLAAGLGDRISDLLSTNYCSPFAGVIPSPKCGIVCLDAIWHVTRGPTPAPPLQSQCWASCFGPDAAIVLHQLRFYKNRAISTLAHCTAALVASRLYCDIVSAADGDWENIYHSETSLVKLAEDRPLGHAAKSNNDITRAHPVPQVLERLKGDDAIDAYLAVIATFIHTLMGGAQIDYQRLDVIIQTIDCIELTLNQFKNHFTSAQHQDLFELLNARGGDTPETKPNLKLHSRILEFFSCIVANLHDSSSVKKAVGSVDRYLGRFPESVAAKETWLTLTTTMAPSFYDSLTDADSIRARP